MRAPLFRVVLAGVAILSMWMMPSGGTQGQGALGDQFIHPDRGLLVADGRSPGGETAALSAVHAADRVAAGSVIRF